MIPALALFLALQQEGASAWQEAVARAKSDELEALRILRSLPFEEARTLEAMAFLHLKVRLFEEAREFATRRKRTNPRSPVADVYLGDVALRVRRFEEAIGHYDNALSGAEGDLKEEILRRKHLVAEEQNYRRLAEKTGRAFFWGGIAVLGFLLFSPFLILVVLRKSP